MLSQRRGSVAMTASRYNIIVFFFFKLERKRTDHISTFFLVVFFPVMRLTGDEFRFLCVHPFVVISFFFYSKANGCTMTDRQHQIQEALSKGAFRLDLSCFNIQKKKKKKKFCRRMTHTKGEGRFICIKIYILQIGWQRIKKRRKKRESHHHSEKRKKSFLLSLLGKIRNISSLVLSNLLSIGKRKSNVPFFPQFPSRLPHTLDDADLKKREMLREKETRV